MTDQRSEPSDLSECNNLCVMLGAYLGLPHTYSPTLCEYLGQGSKEKQEFTWVRIQICPSLVSTELICGQKPDLLVL